MLRPCRRSPLHLGVLLVALGLFVSMVLLIPPDTLLCAHVHAQTLGPVTAGGGDVSMRIDFGFEGRFRAGYWAPVRITLTNSGLPKDAVLSVVTRHGSPLATLSHTTTYSRRLHLPSGPAITAEFFPLLSNTYHPLRAELRDGGGELLATVTLDLANRATDGTLVVALDASGQEWSWLSQQLTSTSGLRGRITGLSVAYVENPQALPSSWIAYHGVSALLVSSSFPMSALSDAQTAAIAKWVEAGGTLVWAGGHRTQSVKSTLGRTLMPVQLSGTTRRLPGDAPLSRYPAFPEAAEVIVWDGEQADGTILAHSNGSPMVVRQSYGKGSVMVIAFDPAGLARHGWSGLGDLARDLITHALPLSSGFDATETVIWEYMESVRLPHAPRIVPGALSLGYVVTLAGALWLINRRTVRRVYTAVGIVFIASLFSIASVTVLGPLAKRSQNSVAEVAISYADASGFGDRWHYFGLWSESAASWRVRSAPDGWTQAPLKVIAMETRYPNVTVEGEGSGTLQVDLTPQMFGRFVALSPAELALDTRLTLQAQEYRLDVRNETPTPIDVLYYVHPSQFANLGSLSVGAAAQHRYAAGAQTARHPSAQWMGEAVANDLLQHSDEVSPELASVFQAVVTRRLQNGPAGLAFDDGFLVGITHSDSSIKYDPQATVHSTHIFLLDLTLAGSAL